MNPELSSPWNDIAPELNQTKNATLVVTIQEPINQWNVENSQESLTLSESGPYSPTPFTANMHSKGISIDTARYYNDAASVSSLPDTPTRDDTDTEFIIQNINQRNQIENKPQTQQEEHQSLPLQQQQPLPLQQQQSLPLQQPPFNTKLATSSSPFVSDMLSAMSFEGIAHRIKKRFVAVKEATLGTDQKSIIDWDYWGKLINDFDGHTQKHPRVLQKNLQQGIPTEIRGMVWQLITKSTNLELEKMYAHLITRTSSYEKLITRDLNRTFPNIHYFQQEKNQQALFNVVKAYSLYDPEVGYCQGISFIVGPLLLNMPEEQAFCVLVKLMKIYQFREIYTPQMYGLHLRLYQFDHLLIDLFPEIDKHFEEEGIKSSMYASQWFMTLFAYRFPLDIVFRIMDIVVGVGIEAVFRFSFALLKKNQEKILSLEFEPLLEYLKTGLFDVYLSGSIDTLMIDASEIKLKKSRVDKLKKDWEHDQIKVDPEYLSSDALRQQNVTLREQMKRMEQAYEQLNKEHIVLANQYLAQSINQEKMNDSFEGMQEKMDEFQSIIDGSLSEPMYDNEEMQRLANKNMKLVQRNCELEDRISELEYMLVEVRMRHAQSESNKDVRTFDISRR